ncbi:MULTISPECIES: hypothetical protein [Streptomyces]|uniref:Secreted protein n=1 Tax=Streptomyces caniscabiei TaxID=2746961 RepID=A0ABU4MG14_9ACTN|nr:MULTISPECIES: hypothetical protein [Streptomyces]MDX2943285.1 hypothetical protein [Streptomyces caniscabiei]MDX2952502.1 hypothetical protein [Streptomyces caniscabiei]MDX2985847.1 hypothetical protein [Streptomyces caniscabiei]MDX3009059.1 hypothetical protein [Streptomyces caniscabiei]MDX3036406.1 hypothetical protein [Streptomyces caniscabiei]
MKPETLISMSATVIALASLWVSFTESRSIRSHNRQSVRPLLQIRRVLNFEGTRTGIQLVNAGLGPAVVTRSVVRVDGDVVGEWDLRMYRQLTRGHSVQPKVSTLQPGVPVLSGQVVHLLFFDDFDQSEHAWFWTLVSERLMVEIFYESMYGGENFRAALVPPWEPPS